MSVLAPIEAKRLVGDMLDQLAPPLLCTGGWPNTAVAAVLDAAQQAGMEILVHADGDAAGIAIAAHVLRRPGATPWQIAATPADTETVGFCHEEAMVDELLEDLAARP
ncbi:MAG: DUF2399 domain-containing protein [Solirubrobacteraceae bacterium]